MTMPTPACPHRMQVHSLIQETPEVYTLRLICHDVYHYQPGMYALVSIGGSDTVLRAYTLSSSPGHSRFICLTVRRLPAGKGSPWLTGSLKPGNELWLSPAMGDFTCIRHAADRYLMLAAGCGVTPIMSMTRWLLSERRQSAIQVIYSVRTPKEMIFADEWQQLARDYPQLQLTIIAEAAAGEGQFSGRLSLSRLQQWAPDIRQRMVMICGPLPYMEQARQFALALDVPASHLQQESFGLPAGSATAGSPPVASSLRLSTRRPLADYHSPVGTRLLFAMEQHGIPVNAACRAGVCGSCKTRIHSGDYSVSSRMTLSDEEVAAGYVLACSCRLEGDVILA